MLNWSPSGLKYKNINYDIKYRLLKKCVEIVALLSKYVLDYLCFPSNHQVAISINTNRCTMIILVYPKQVSFDIVVRQCQNDVKYPIRYFVLIKFTFRQSCLQNAIVVTFLYTVFINYHNQFKLFINIASLQVQQLLHLQ